MGNITEICLVLAQIVKATARDQDSVKKPAFRPLLVALNAACEILVKIANLLVGHFSIFGQVTANRKYH